MASITLNNASVDIPVFATGNNSLKTTLLRKAVGGKFGHSGANLLINALSNVSLDIRDGERVGLIGRNGAGKTTLLRVLAGVYPPTAGSARVIGRVAPMFDLSLGMSVDATGFENIRICGTLWGLKPAEIEAGIDDIVEFTELGDYLKIPVRTYSAGMLLRLSFAIATLRQPEILLLDEVIGVGDAAFLAKAKARLARMVTRAQILVVSTHSDLILRDLCDKAIWLERGCIAAYGPVEEVLAAYKASINDVG
jgi:ABC-2 type transport system ATP-binding protein/lipopolysaccharide transport system ATP-binding protein